MFKILLAKFSASKDEEAFQKAVEYLDGNKASFGIEMDYLKVKL